MSEKKIQPWVRGIIDTLVGAGVLLRCSIPHRNRLAVILIDSAFETASRAYLKHVLHIKLDDSHRHRDNLMKVIKAKLAEIDQDVWNSIDYYYNEIRCDFYHQSAGKTLTDEDLLDYKDTIEFVVNKAFDTRIQDHVTAEIDRLDAETLKTADTKVNETAIRPSDVAEKINKVLVAVGYLHPQGVKEVNDYFKKEGESLRLKPDEFNGIVSRNRGSKRLFYYDRDAKRWELSGLGRFKLQQFPSEVQHGG